MGGITHHVSIAPPVSQISMPFMAVSMAIMEISDMPIAVLKATRSAICRERISVSSAMDVSKPLAIANAIMASVGQAIPVAWKKAMVPKSPMAQPSRHQAVFLDALRQVCGQRQWMVSAAVKTVMKMPFVANCPIRYAFQLLESQR